MGKYNMRKSTVLITILTLLGLFALYSFAWVYASRLIESFLRNNSFFADKKIELSGYPLDVRFKIHYDAPEESKSNVDTITFNLFSRKISLVTNLLGTNPIIIPSSGDREISIKNKSDFIFYFKLHDYFKTINYIKTHENFFSPIDLFNLAQNIGLEYVASIDHKKEAATEIVDFWFDIGIPEKKIYENFDDLTNDIPHILTVNATAKIQPLTRDDTKSFLRKFYNLTYPASCKISSEISLPNRTFVASDFKENLKNITLNIAYSENTLMNYSKGHFSISNTSDLTKVNLDTSSFYSKKYFDDFNKTITKDDFFEIVKHLADMYNFKLTPVQDKKLRLFTDAMVAKPYVLSADNEVKSHFDIIIPHEAKSDNHSQYALHIWDNLKHFDLDLKGELEAFSSNELPKDAPKTHGTLSLKDSEQIFASIAELVNLFILFSEDEVTPEAFKKRLSHLEENISLIADFEKTISDEPISNSGDLHYSYDINFDPLKMLESKISNTHTLGDTFKKFYDLTGKFVNN